MEHINRYGGYTSSQDPEMLEQEEQELEKVLAKESSYRKALSVISKLGYNTIQEAVVDLLVEGEYNKSNGTWTEITDPSDIKTTRAHMNLAQAKYYGLEIIRAEPE